MCRMSAVPAAVPVCRFPNRDKILLRDLTDRRWRRIQLFRPNFPPSLPLSLPRSAPNSRLMQRAFLPALYKKEIEI